MIQILISFIGFWLYQKLIYYDQLFVFAQLRAAHALFSLSAILWLPGKTPVWVIVPLILNSTRIELFNISICVENIWPFFLYVMKNIPIAICFVWAHSLNYSTSYVVSVLFIDFISTKLWEYRIYHLYHNTFTTTHYLSIATLK